MGLWTSVSHPRVGQIVMCMSTWENWLTHEGGRIVRKVAAKGPDPLDERERLVYEVWLFDTEQRNGGVSQYFCNRSLDQWQTLGDLASRFLPTFSRKPICLAED